MYKLKTVIGKEAIELAAKANPPMGPGFTEIHPETEKMEVWGSSFDDPGSDFTEWRLIDANDQVLDKRKIDGF